MSCLGALNALVRATPCLIIYTLRLKYMTLAPSRTEAKQQNSLALFPAHYQLFKQVVFMLQLLYLCLLHADNAIFGSRQIAVVAVFRGQ